MTRFDKYKQERDWNKKISKVKNNMQYRKHLYQEKVRNRFYSFGLFLFGTIAIITTRDGIFLLFSLLGIWAWKETNKIESI